MCPRAFLYTSLAGVGCYRLAVAYTFGISISFGLMKYELPASMQRITKEYIVSAVLGLVYERYMPALQ